MPHHARAAGWTSEGDRMWLHRCDQCGKRRLVDTYFEIYPPLHSKGEQSGWWWACASCMVNIAARRLLSLPEAAVAPARVTAGGFAEVFGPCIQDENGAPLVAVDHLAVDAVGIRDRLLEALQ